MRPQRHQVLSIRSYEQMSVTLLALLKLNSLSSFQRLEGFKHFLLKFPTIIIFVSNIFQNHTVGYLL